MWVLSQDRRVLANCVVFEIKKYKDNRISWSHETDGVVYKIIGSSTETLDKEESSIYYLAEYKTEDRAICELYRICSGISIDEKLYYIKEDKQ